MRLDLRWPILITANFALLFFVAEANHWLAPVGLYLLPAGLLPLYGAVRLGYRPGLAATVLTGLLLDAGRPSWFGLSLLLLGLGHATIFVLRARLAADQPWRLAALAAGGTLAYLLGLTLAQWPAQAHAASYWSRAAVDALFSAALAALLCPWFMALQATTLRALGFDRRDEQAERAAP